MGWQDFIAIGIVLGSLLYLGSLTVGGLRRSGSGKGCGSSCGKCASGNSQAGRMGVPNQLIEIGLTPLGSTGTNRVKSPTSRA